MSHIKAAIQAIEIEINGLKKLVSSIPTTFDQVVDRVLECKGHTIVTGIGKSGHIGMKIVATLASTGTPALFVHAAEAAHGDLGMIGASDIVIAISNSGESAELMPILQYCRRFKVPVIAITSNAQSTLAKLAEYVLLLPEATEACPLSLAPMTSTTMTLVLGDALAAALLKARGFQREDFAHFHPGGKLGAQLMTLKELIENKPNLAIVPQVKEQTPVPEAIIEITEGRRGVVAVLNEAEKIVGVVTDGDLRRAMSEEIFHKSVVEIMTKSPLKIPESSLTVDALAMFEKHKVSALFVTDNNDAMKGLVHLQDLLSVGVV
ncbi:MAG: KpsF/GutQ family sugar-phosphate isomerase [Pseudomonadota bacterium]